MGSNPTASSQMPEPGIPVSPPSLWAKGETYEPYVGRWSRLVAEGFLRWLDVDRGDRWVDIGCGTGALTTSVLRLVEPAAVTGIDPSSAFVSYARAQIRDRRATFTVGSAAAIPARDDAYDRTVSGLVLNFLPDARAGLREMRRVTREGGSVACYVWDYAEGMEMMRRFWDAAIELDPGAARHDEGARFPICRPDALEALWREEGLVDVATSPIDIETRFAGFDDYWAPFLGGDAPAPAYAMSLEPTRRTALERSLRELLPVEPDGTIPLRARAWAVRGTV